jgi:ubiquinone/menaquinone biosynthesis C-methylase UbiE
MPTTNPTYPSVSLSPEYMLGRSESETRRLMLQHQLFAPITRRLFEAAGIGRGMRVLDVGSGAGDVALLLADLVGPTGQVIGVDQNDAVLETARARAHAAGWNNVSFRTGNLWQLSDVPEVDAVVGRWILMHVATPARLVERLAGLLRPGGIVAFQESDFTYPPRTFPELPLARRIHEIALGRGIPGGPDMAMGSRLFEVFLDAGLSAPQMRVETQMGGGPDWLGYEYLTETLRSLLPVLQRLTDLDPAEVEIDTLAARLRAEAAEHSAVQMLPLLVGAWARKEA